MSGEIHQKHNRIEEISQIPSFEVENNITTDEDNQNKSVSMKNNTKNMMKMF